MQRGREYLRAPSGVHVIIGLFYLGLISAAEAITTLWEPQVGMLIHGLVLVLLLIHGSVIRRGILMRFLILLSIAPLIRILSLSLPLQTLGLPLIYWYMVIGILLFLAAFLAGRVTDLHGGRIGWRIGRWPVQLGIGLLGFGLGYVEFLILKPGPLAADITWIDIVVASLILMVFTGVLEEFIFRGLLQSATMQLMGVFGLFYVALLFAVLHLGYHSLADVVFVLLVGLFFGWLVWKTHSILGASLAHGIANISLYIIFPLLISAGSLPVASEDAPAGHSTGPVTTATPMVPAEADAGDILVDDRDPGFVFVGLNLWNDETEGFAGSFRWTYAVQSVPDIVATWVPPVAKCGTYRVEVYIPFGSGLTWFAEYIINHRWGTDVFVVNQMLASGSWTSIGVYEFEEGSAASVQLSNRTGEEPKLLRWIGFDAMRWIYRSECTAMSSPSNP